MNAPACPNVGTLSSRALALLLQGQAITHRDFWLHAGTYRLSADIHLLREMGWDIRDTPETVPTSDPTKRRAHIKRYHLPNEAISTASEAGRDYVRKVQEWERKRAVGMTGTAATAPADKAAGTLGQATDQAKVSTGAGL
ncbi:MAG: helix-turn-helix domain-containing protein [Sulfuriferula sp.]